MNMSVFQGILVISLGVFAADVLTSILRNGIAWLVYRRMRAQMNADLAKMALAPKIPKVTYDDDDELPEVIN